MLESDLWLMFLKLCPQAERIENAVKFGTPDVVFPTKQNGWMWLELKLAHGNEFAMEKSQYAFASRMTKTSIRLEPYYLIWSEAEGGGKLLRSSDVMVCPRRAYKDKVWLLTNERVLWSKLVDITAKMGVYNEK